MHGRLRIIFFKNGLGFCTFFQCLKRYDLTLPLNASDQYIFKGNTSIWAFFSCYLSDRLKWTTGCDEVSIWCRCLNCAVVGARWFTERDLNDTLQVLSAVTQSWLFLPNWTFSSWMACKLNFQREAKLKKWNKKYLVSSGFFFQFFNNRVYNKGKDTNHNCKMCLGIYVVVCSLCQCV